MFALVDRKIMPFEWELSMDALSFDAAIGKGSYGVVYCGTLDSRVVAIKRLNKGHELDDEVTLSFLYEISLVAACSHKNVLPHVGSVLGHSTLCLVTEYCAGGNLRDYLVTTRRSWKLKLRFAREIAAGMQYLHSRRPPIVHRDLKADNILVSDLGEIKISDFGLATRLAPLPHNAKKGSVNWMAPEVLLTENPFTLAGDVYSYGMVQYELLMDGKPPYYELTPLQTLSSITENILPTIPSELTTDANAAYRELMTATWDRNLSQRPPFSQIHKVTKKLEREGASTTPQSPSSAKTSSNSKKRLRKKSSDGSKL